MRVTAGSTGSRRDSFGARGHLDVDDRRYELVRLDALGSLGADVQRLPYSLKVLLENLLRHEDGTIVTADDIAVLAGWDGRSDTHREIAYSPARVLMQDFTGVPALVDLAGMRDAAARLGGDAAAVRPTIPAELVIDHSVVADVTGRSDALRRNSELEYERNHERYRFLRWGQGAFSSLRVVPPETGICHQVNLEHLARVVFTDGSLAYPDTCVGTDSHTPMVNGVGVVGWGVGGIEAEAALLGQPVPMLIPPVVGLRLAGELPEGSTATDLVLTVTELLRAHGVVGKFVEFWGPGVGSVALATRATIGNMSPEYGSTISIFPIDDETLRYLELTGRPADQVRLVEAYAKEQGLWHDRMATPAYTETLELDLGSVLPCLAGPARPQDRVALTAVQASFASALVSSLPDTGPQREAQHGYDEAVDETFPASDPPAAEAGVTDEGESSDPPARPLFPTPSRPRNPRPVVLADGTHVEIDHGHVVIAAITSCTNTSNPTVMVAAGLLAARAVELGLRTKPWVKTSLAPGSKVVVDYYEAAGLTAPLDALGFQVVGFGCTTCIGNSGPLLPGVTEAVHDGDLAVASVLSGNRNFEGRINPDVRMNYLASPPLVVAYALAGTMDIDLTSEPLGTGHDGADVFLRDIWPSSAAVDAVITRTIKSSMFTRTYAEVFTGDERWRALAVPEGDRYRWDPSSTYIREPPFFEGITRTPPPIPDIEGARALAVLGDSVTTDHISPAGTIRAGQPAGRWLIEQGVDPGDFNSYGARRGNHEVMIRGTFASPRLRNRLRPGTEGGVTVHLPDGEPTTIYEAATRYAAEGTPLVVLAGKEYGSGSSRDWAAKGTALLGVRAVIAESFERIHRSNLVGMGVLPLQFSPGESVDALGLTGHETFAVAGLASGALTDRVQVRADDRSFDALVRIDTPKEREYFRHGGILPYVLRHLVG